MRYIITITLKYNYSALTYINYRFPTDIEFKSIYFTFSGIAVEKLFYFFFLHQSIKKRVINVTP